MRSSGHSIPVIKMLQDKTKAAAWTGAGVAFCSLCSSACAAQAQGAAPFDGTQVPVIGSAAVAPLTSGPAMLPSSTTRVVPTPSLISLNFEDEKAAIILGIIAEQGKVNIMIGGDVTGIVRKVLLNDVTPETAIRYIASTANLVYKKMDDNTYVIAKTLPPDLSGPPQAPILLPQPGNTLSGGFTMPIAPNLNSLNLPPLSNAGNGASQEDAPHTAFKLISLKNLPPRMMAWTLDPQHHPKPTEILQSDMNARRFTEDRVAQLALDPREETITRTSVSVDADASALGNDYADSSGGLGQFSTPDGGAYTEGNAQRRGRGGRGGGARGGLGGGGGGGGFDLPEGVDRIIAVEPQNALLVFGTTEGVNRLQEIVSILDQPLRQVEIEAQFVTISSAEARNLGVSFSGSNGTFSLTRPNTGGGSTVLGFVRGNFQATLSALISKNRLKVVQSPRVTAINNLTASLLSTTRTPIILQTINTNVNNGINQQTAQRLIYINTSIGLTVRPTINNDDTITVVMQPEVSTQTDVGNAVGAPQVNTQKVQTVANVRDGDTIALGGLRTKTIIRNKDRIPVLSKIPLIGQFFTNVTNTDSDTDLIIFVTARIIRRADDNTAVVGTVIGP